MKSFAIYGASDDLVEQQADGKPHDETGQPRSFAFVGSCGKEYTLHRSMSVSYAASPLAGEGGSK